VSAAPAEPGILILLAIDAAAGDRYARLGHTGRLARGGRL
jgi:hypothetical protein